MLLLLQELFHTGIPGPWRVWALGPDLYAWKHFAAEAAEAANAYEICESLGPELYI